MVLARRRKAPDPGELAGDSFAGKQKSVPASGIEVDMSQLQRAGDATGGGVDAAPVRAG
jgi:hypothetical protein